MLVIRRSLIGLLLLASSLVLAQGASESLEREARTAFKAGRFKEAAIKFQDAADSATETPRRAKMQLQAAYALFNDKNPKAAEDAVRRALETDADLEIVAEFYSPDFLRVVQEIKRTVRPTPPPAPIDIAELKRVASEKLKDGHAEDVVYDLTHVPPEKLDPEGWKILASAYDATGKPVQAEAARRAAAGGPVASSPSAPPPAAGGDPTAILTDGRAALVRGDLAVAQAAASRALEMQPTSAEAHRLLGDAAAQRGDRAAAETSWKKALELDPKNAAAAESLLGSYLDAKNLDAAVALLSADPALAAKSKVRLTAAARALARDGDPRARQAYAAALKGAPGDTTLATEYGAILLSAGDIGSALEALGPVATAAPSSPAAHANLAAALRRKGDAADAEKEYRQALSLDPDSPQALAGLGVLLLSQGKAAEAVDPLRRAAAREHDNAGVLTALIRAQRESGDASGAVASAQEAKGVDAPALYMEAAAAAMSLGQNGDAAGFFEKALAKDPQNASAKEGLDRTRQAEKFLARLERQRPQQGLVTTK